MIQYQNEDFTVFESQLYKTTSVVVKTNDCVIVVDPNLLPQEVQEIRQHVNKVRGSLPLYIIITHSDWDHVVGCGAFLDATVIGNHLLNKVDKHQILEQIKDFDDKYYLDRFYPITFPQIDIPIMRERHVAKIGRTTITFYQAPGHTTDGVFIVIEPIGLFIAGDYLSDIEFPFIYENSYHYELTLQKVDNILTNHSIEYLVPGHGNISTSKEDILKRKDDALKYIQELRYCIKTNSDSTYLINHYKYWREFTYSHEENILLIKKELK
ncbi:hypothetical protein MTP04_19120 [Lysinibacillus sp. PLM2]|nr:hypothetical protein MTP04_19120 [Lysinibacillus sp. PLM2]